MPTITPEVYTSMGLNDGEFSKILELLGREPTLTELGMFSVMWSEHCGYKYSRPILAYFKKYKEAIEGKGLENAGIIDIGDGLGITMKVESHNHPSAVEPYQGAATGVGGIIRDILTMGARPIALLNSLRFGPIRDGEAESATIERNRYLFDHVVAGIAGYGNCVGVPTVAGEIAFHSRYSGNPLVNAMCVGILNLDQITTAAASGDGNPVYYLGSSTGKDGIHGASFASTGFTEDDEDKRPNVQIGDPFAEKLLIEATLEALSTGAIVAIQDMGAAGLTCSTVEMASMGEVGMHIDLDKVPMRESDMSAYELMLSESQERMFAVVQKGREHEVEQVFAKWGLNVVPVGEVSGACRAVVKRFGKIEADLDPRFLTDHCPTYSPPAEVPEYHKKALQFDPETLAKKDPTEALRTLLRSPNLASKRYVWQQYDQQVLTQTSVVSGVADAAVLAPRGTKKGIAVKLDGNARYVYFDPYVGGQLAICEAARNVACTGARPVAATDGLNFGNPQKPHVFWQFERAVKGVADAAEMMQTPVISGNVSFYNEDSTLGLEVLPTPLIGMVGVMEDASTAISMVPKSPSTMVCLISTPLEEIRQGGLGASDYLAEVHGVEDGVPVAPNVPAERALCDLLADLASRGLIVFAHDSSEGGLAFALAEVSIVSNGGMSVELSESTTNDSSAESQLFGEIPGRVLIGTSQYNIEIVENLARFVGLEFSHLGIWSKDNPNFELKRGNTQIQLSVQALRTDYENSIPNIMKENERS